MAIRGRARINAASWRLRTRGSGSSAGAAGEPSHESGCAAQVRDELGEKLREHRGHQDVAGAREVKVLRAVKVDALGRVATRRVAERAEQARKVDVRHVVQGRDGRLVADGAALVRWRHRRVLRAVAHHV
jgi:hypothetical protein